MNFRQLFFLLFIQFSVSQGNINTIEVNGGNWIEILRNSEYYIDTTNTLKATDISNRLNHFKKNNS